MIVFVNGAFGIGKTSVARALRAQLPRSIIFDPEMVGLPIQYGARLLGRRVVDFQDLRAWRRLTVSGLRAARTLAPTVIVPMAFSNARYLGEIRDGVARFERRAYHFCLVAPLDVVRRRLAARGASPATHPWEFRRAEECCAEHKSEAFERQLDATNMTPDQLAALIASAVSQ